jgi:hypothetical protein
VDHLDLAPATALPLALVASLEMAQPDAAAFTNQQQSGDGPTELARLPLADKTSSRLLAARLSNPSSLAADDGKTAPEHRMQKSARLVVSQDVHDELAAARRANHRRTRLLSRARARRS